MKPNFLLALSILFVLSGLGYAQGIEDIDLDAYFAELNLSEEQKVKFDQITDEYYEELSDIPQRDETYAKMYKDYTEYKKDRNIKMKAILSKSQYKLYTKKQKALEKRARRENMDAILH